MNTQRSFEAKKIDQAITNLKIAKGLLSSRKSLQSIRLISLISNLEEIRDILTDPECEG